MLILSVIICTSGGHFYKVKIIESGQGWGYDILVKNKPYIHQPYIPVIEGETPFPDKKSAMGTGRLVVKKLKSHKIPYITKEELDSILKSSPPIP
ncbi:MAG: DUF4907 domain-containing protein [Bacteroidota bacterium]|nr:DUF4907 domain-containing protein [Bacteroidota bacterium]